MNKVEKDKKVLIRVEDLKQYFPIGKAGLFGKKQAYVKANDGISLDIYEGETLGLVGESGCGKSTLGRSLLQLYEQTAGRTMYYGHGAQGLVPIYVLDILENLNTQKKNLEDLKNKEEELLKKLETLADGDEKNDIEKEYEVANKKRIETFEDITQLTGGLILADDLDSVSKVLLKEYKANAKLFSIQKSLDEENKKINNIKSTLEGEEGTASDTKNLREYKEKVTKLEKDFVKVEDELKAASEDREELEKKYSSLPDFEKYQSYKDDGVNLTKLVYKEMRTLRSELQLIFQDPYSSLNPRQTVGQIISEGLYAHHIFKKNDRNVQEYLLETMDQSGLAPYFIHRYPHQFSGGQRQRIGIARSIALNPKFIVCDEAVSALDVSIQSQIINLLIDLKEQEDLTYLFISHDLSVIKHISDRVAVMYLGNIVELADTSDLYSRPMHPYTEALLSAIPTTDIDDDKEVILIEGDIPSPINPPSGCKFHTRCQYATQICKEVPPPFEEVEPGHFVACYHKRNVEDL